MTSPLAGAAKVGDIPASPMPNATSAGMTIARIILSLQYQRGADRGVSRDLTFGDRVAAVPRFGRQRRAFIRQPACRQIAPQRDDKRHWAESTPGNQNGAWLTHSSLVHWTATH
jgi:hypothetical protein